MSKKREELLEQIWAAQDTAYDLMSEYDSLPHSYGENVLYQAEAHLIDRIALHPGVTVTDLANMVRKTPSACSQLIRKLREKGWISQILNTENHREYRLFLTDSGKKIFRDHDAFEQRCYQRSFHRLDGFSEEDFKTYIAIQKCLNESFALDVEESRCNLPANKPDDL